MQPVNRLWFLTCDMPRRLAAGFLDELCPSADRRREVETRLDALTLAELTPLPQTSEYNGLAAKLAEQSRIATFERVMPDLSPRGTLEWMKLDQKLRWLEGHPSRTEEHIVKLADEYAAELLRSENPVSRAVRLNAGLERLCSPLSKAGSSVGPAGN